MSKIHEIIVVGAGASGLMFGALVQQRVLFIDVNEQIAMKLKISGGGKCNITNTTVKTSDYLGDSEFISHALGELSSSELLSFFDGVELQERKYGQIFGANSSKDFIDVLKKRNIKNEFKLNTKVLHVQKNGEFFEVQTSDGNFLSKKLIVASGGVSFAQVGVSEIGYKIASDFGHSIKKISPALVGLTIQKEQFWFKELSGISFFANATCSGRRFGGDLLFSHKGISGPLALDISLFWEKGRVSLDFLPDFEICKTNSNALISTFLPLPKRFLKLFLQSVGLEDKKMSVLNSSEFERLSLLKNYEFSPAGTVGFNKAEVTKGGVSTDEVDCKSFESKLQSGLYFIGEVLDATGRLGGYNLHWAFASATSLARNLT